jgi:glycosyltransferase involved in cell wall biosynthesis
VELDLDIITVTKEDLEGVVSTIQSTRTVRSAYPVRQIVVDSSETDKREKLKEFIRDEQNIDYIWQEPSGIAAAFNLALSKSKADWVWFLNGGDRIHYDIDPEKLLYILTKSSADTIIFQIELMQSHTIIKHPPLWAAWPPVSSWIPHPGTIIRRLLFEKYGLFREEYKVSMDFEIWLRFFSKNVVVDMISLPIALYDESGVSTIGLSCSAKETLKIIRLKLPILIQKWLGNGFMILSETKRYLMFRILRRD